MVGALFLLNLNPADARAEHRALVVVDMHQSALDEWEKTTEVQKKLRALIEKQRQLIAVAKRNKIPILVLQWIKQGPTAQELMKRIGTAGVVMEKDKNGLFDSSSADKAKELLKKWGATDLFVVGIDGGACVTETIWGAVKNGYKVWAVTDAIAEHSQRAKSCKQGPVIYPYSLRVWTDDFDPRSCNIPYQESPPKLSDQKGFRELDTDQAIREMASNK